MTDVSGNVEAISSYTIGTSGTITLATYNIFASIAAAQIVQDDPSSLLSSAESNVAQAMYVCHLIQQRQGLAGKISESGIGRYGYSRGSNAGLTAWLDSYHTYLKSIQQRPVDLTDSTYTEGWDRDDKTTTGLHLDQSTAYDLDDETRDDT